jgi:hypothetical protein
MCSPAIRCTGVLIYMQLVAYSVNLDKICIAAGDRFELTGAKARKMQWD